MLALLFHRAVQRLFCRQFLLGLVLLLALVAIALSPAVDLPPRLRTGTVPLLFPALCATIVGMWVLSPFWFRRVAEAAATPVDLWPTAESTAVRRC